MTAVPLAHIGGMPVEETLGALGPVLLALTVAASARLSSLIHNHNKGGT